MASPLARGLFHRAIAESGALFPTPSRAPASLDDAERTGCEFMRHAGAGSLAELRSMPAEQILAASPGLGFRPLVDGHFLPRSPAAIFAEGAQSDVPLLAGGTRTKASTSPCCRAPTLTGPIPSWSARFLRNVQEALGHYPGGSRKRDRAGARALGGDLTIIHATWAFLEAHRKTGRSAIFRFRFERAPLTPEGWFEGRPSKEAGAFHAGEILYVFNNLHAFPWLLTADDHRIADLASGYWLNFVKTGDPNGPGLPAWPSYRRADDPFMAIDAAPQIRSDSDRTRHEFLDVARNKAGLR